MYLEVWLNLEIKKNLMRTNTAGGGRHAEGSGLLQRAGRRDRERGKVKFQRQQEWDKGNME